MAKRCSICNKKFGRKEIDQHLAEAHRKSENPFKCFDGCVECCIDSTMPIEISIADLKKLADHLKITPREVFFKYCIVGARQALKPGSINHFFPIIAFRHPCKFLKNSKCSVYPARPSVCRLFPYLLKYEKSDYPYLNYKCVEEGLINFTSPELKQLEELQESGLKEYIDTKRILELNRSPIQLEMYQYNQLLPEFNEMTGLGVIEVKIQDNQYKFYMNDTYNNRFKQIEHTEIFKKLVHTLANEEINKRFQKELLENINSIR